MSEHTSTDTARQPVIEVSGLQLAYGKQSVLQGLDWQLMPGQVVGLLGRNGAGKTTLIESMLGLLEPDAGKVRVFGERPDRLSDATRARIGYVLQTADLFPWLTPAQLLRYFKTFYPRWNEAKVQRLLREWDIDVDKSIAKLSTGQQQRLSIIRALAHEPDLLVLDEPVASLDPVGRRDFLRELIDIVIDQGTTVVFSTHILSDLERVAVDVAFLAQGRIALQAPLGELMERTRRVVGEPAAVAGFLSRRRLTPLNAAGSAEKSPLVLLPDGEPAPDGEGVQLLPASLEELFSEITR